MRRADRLFQIVQHLRGRRLITGAQLAERLQVSLRTVYRDIQDLSLSGVPVDGEAGVGYRLRASFDLPPLMFTYDEVEALVIGMRMVESWGGPKLAAAARSALGKVEAALPKERRDGIIQSRLYAPGFHLRQDFGLLLEEIRQAIHDRWKVDLQYTDTGGKESSRRVRPLGLFYWGSTWTLTAWCETREDFRSFRVDRVGRMTVTRESFAAEAGRELEDFLRYVRGKGGAPIQ
jgi:predicted DNA-binding transcriptional regulator YafY